MDENKAMCSACLFLAIYLKYGRHWVAHQYSAVRSIEKKICIEVYVYKAFSIIIKANQSCH